MWQRQTSCHGIVHAMHTRRAVKTVQLKRHWCSQTSPACRSWPLAAAEWLHGRVTNGGNSLNKTQTVIWWKTRLSTRWRITAQILQRRTAIYCDTHNFKGRSHYARRHTSPFGRYCRNRIVLDFYGIFAVLRREVAWFCSSPIWLVWSLRTP